MKVDAHRALLVGAAGALGLAGSSSGLHRACVALPCRHCSIITVPTT